MLSIIGLTHKTAPLRIREHLAFSVAELEAVLPVVGAIDGVAESLILSTCNRTELYLVSRIRPDLSALARTLGRLRSVSPEE
ncbi:MAG TPA: glutamyl-tRNA reductase, partial [bacterium]|nr:glutamyl-tRNA reductase [bacterium]